MKKGTSIDNTWRIDNNWRTRYSKKNDGQSYTSYTEVHKITQSKRESQIPSTAYIHHKTLSIQYHNTNIMLSVHNTYPIQ